MATLSLSKAKGLAEKHQIPCLGLPSSCVGSCVYRQNGRGNYTVVRYLLPISFLPIACPLSFLYISSTPHSLSILCEDPRSDHFTQIVLAASLSTHLWAHPVPLGHLCKILPIVQASHCLETICRHIPYGLKPSWLVFISLIQAHVIKEERLPL